MNPQLSKYALASKKKGGDIFQPGVLTLFSKKIKMVTSRSLLVFWGGKKKTFPPQRRYGNNTSEVEKVQILGHTLDVGSPYHRDRVLDTFFSCEAIFAAVCVTVLVPGEATVRNISKKCCHKMALSLVIIVSFRKLLTYFAETKVSGEATVRNISKKKIA